MKLAYQIPGKLKISILLTGLIGLILLKNLHDRSITWEIKSSMESLYKDRLLAESYIMQLSDEFHGLKSVLDKNYVHPQKSINLHLKNIEQISLDFLNTRLTEEEKIHFENFESLSWDITQKIRKREIPDSLIDSSLIQLRILSEIQVREAQLLLSNTDKAFSFKEIQSYLEIAIVIFLGLLIQSILFASKTLRVISKAPSNLN